MLKKFLLACISCMMLFSCAYAENELDYKEVRAKALKGDAKSQYNLGVIYDEGYKGVKKNQKEAIKWYRKAASQNYPEAFYNLGVAYAHGFGVKKDETEAVKWYLKAAEHGLSVAYYNLGVM